MFEFLKIVHLLALVGAMGMTAANIVIMQYVATIDVSLRAPFGALQRSIGAFGVMALAILWLSGLILFLLRYDWAHLYGWFGLKLLFVVLLTGLVISVRKMGARAINDGQPPPSEKMARMMKAGLGSAVLAVVCAVLAFA